jgi:NitT/TauT family transport system substrate-binding protein
MTLRHLLNGFVVASAISLVMGAALPARAQQPLKDIRIGITSKSLIYAPLYYAFRKGMFKDAGLNVEIVDAGGGTKVAAGLAGGSFQVTLNAIDHYFAASSHKQKWLMLGQLLEREPYTYAMRKDLAAKKGITENSSFSDRLKAIDGLTVGISSLGSGTHIALGAVMEGIGLDPNKIKWVPIGDPLAIVSALQHGRIDVGGRAPGPAEIAVSRGVGTMVVDFSKDFDGKPYPTIVVITTTEMRDKYKPEMTVLMKALDSGLKSMRKNSGEVAQVIRADFAAMDDLSYQAGVDFALKTIPESVAVTKEEFQRAVDHSNKGFALAIRAGVKIDAKFEDAIDQTLVSQ